MANKTRIFLAHASEDKPQIRRLYADLKDRGFNPWLDETDLVPGQVWKDEIPKAIADAAVFLACISAQSCGKVGYVQNEFRRALVAFGERPPGSIYLVPVRLDKCEVPDLRISDLELSLKDIHWVDLWQEGGFDRVITAVEQALNTFEAISEEPIVPAVTHSPEVEPFRDLEQPWCPEMVVIPSGTFWMGSRDEGFDEEKPQHKVTISQSFALSRYAITFDEYDQFCEETDREMPDDEGWGRERRPVINVSFADALAYCDWLSQITNAEYRLPTEAEWEYACRAGTTTAFNLGGKLSKKQANFDREAIKGKTKKVGRFPANAWGLHDMHGNVAEWCADGMRKYSRRAVTDPIGPIGSKVDRVVRGGSWFDFGWVCSSSHRTTSELDDEDDKIGFRCARVLT